MCLSKIFSPVDQSLKVLVEVMTRLAGQEVVKGTRKRGRSKECGTDEEAHFVIRINGRVTQVPSAAPSLNLRQLLGQAGVLLQDITDEETPILLLPCPNTGNVTVHPNHNYRLVKFVGEHMCLAGAMSHANNNSKTDHVAIAAKDGEAEKKSPLRSDIWAMAELWAVIAFMQEHRASCVQDFLSLPVERMATYYSRGVLNLRRQCFSGVESESSDEEVEESEVCYEGKEDEED
ncbi:hypothetical protein, conserved [Trypanosoma brucei brucei TREU927]|uniref:Uncharacterized protein n=2 Tax=Trypanozoon TaxID=39700 RepID=Q581C3_TRYB2|nr:hypothetical protein, conserved [Trypanosoma brucei brucei TREU927]XP_847239.1 hypothetical protein, conserved [Trypanosoma brucei brucei TREU927]AAX78925.1 hypothetical protein, conserved [Trypanosoma brucei]AAX78930.1 hypothetical protein, conserved [Trypanosoma brucei]AAZ13168.1 hypothetical protein, conserved [Trypanosoma brucei brucei TREU927]AAZ13173.1 hypothetical protein, conserved [Trypanosoma brucei brucei TREU927]